MGCIRWRNGSRSVLQLQWLMILLFYSIILVTGNIGLFGGRYKKERSLKWDNRNGDKTNNHHDDYEHVHSLVETVGKAIYRTLDRPKYRFYMYMIIGKFNEESTVLLVSSLCNVLYGIFVLVGFWLLPRERMLLITALTVYIGPALILLFIGGFVLLIVSFALYPVSAVFAVWVWFFLSSHLAQVIGKYLGLDDDEDGNVDILDLLHYFAKMSWGECIGLLKLHAYLKQIRKDPLEEIRERLDDLVARYNETIEAASKSNRGEQSVSANVVDDSAKSSNQMQATKSPKGVEEYEKLS